jgi:hypothetical protein
MKIHNLTSKYLCLLFIIFLSASSVLGLDWNYDTSTRIEALGTDFAGVLKDLQTDIEVRSPVYVEGYRALTIFHRGHDYQWDMPLSFSLFYNHFGLALSYGGHYFLNTNTTNPKDEFYRFNLSGFWSKENYGFQYEFFIDDQDLDYAGFNNASSDEDFTFNSITFGYRPSNLSGFDFRCRIGLGYYDSTYSEFIGGQLTPTAQTKFFIPSAQIGVSYERNVFNNGVLNLLADLGGPASGFELRRLPLPFQSTVWRNSAGTPSALDNFANSFSTRVAGAVSYVPRPSLLICFGVNDFWSGAQSQQENRNNSWINIFSLPLGIEYKPTDNISLRGGVRAAYYYQYSRQQLSQVISYWWRAQSLGLGIRLFKDWFLDITSLNNLLAIESIDLSLRKELN